MTESANKIEKAKEFKFAKFRFYLQPLEKIYLPRYKGSALRGGFGNIFKKTVCMNSVWECNKCLLQETKNYQQVKIHYLAPLRIVLRGAFCTKFYFNLLIINLLRRLAWLSIVHSDKELEFNYRYFISCA